VTLEPLALSRATQDRAAHRRPQADLVPRLLADPTTLVLHLAGDRAAVTDGRGGPRLVLTPTAAAALDGGPTTDGRGRLLAFLGEDVHGRSYLLSAGPDEPDQPAATAPDEGAGARLAGLRDVGWLLDDTQAGLLTTAVALANWHAAHPRCARCGQPTDVAMAGWTRSCPACGAEHFPRTDPAVIMSVIDDSGRILLGRQHVWPAKRFSTLAGFVEPGESLEAAVQREIFEETGVHSGEVSYLGSQPWPFPASVMVAFQARAVTTGVDVDGAELEDARWWTREDFGIDVATGELVLPPRVSIARRIIEHWYGSPVRDAAQAWR